MKYFSNPKINGTPNMINNEIKITIGVYIFANLLIKRSPLDLLLLASNIISLTFEAVDSLYVVVAFILIAPSLFIKFANTLLPLKTSRGLLSPVKEAVFNELDP